MASYVAVLLLVAFLLCCSPTSAFNITDIFDQLRTPDFNVFNSYLTQTLVAGDINSRQTITVLAVDNSAISALSGQPLDVIRNVLSVHVILDYFDVAKFQSLNNGTGLLVTMFQATGLATGQMGFLNATDFPGGAVALGSAVPGAGLNANLVKSLFEQPYNISVLQVSSVIIPPGIQNLAQPSPPPPPPPPAAAPIPSAAPPKSAPAPKKAPSAAPTPAAAPKAAPSPKKAPSAAPTPAATPSAPTPTSKGAPAAAPAAPSPSKPASPPAPAAAQPPTSSAPQSPLPSAPAEAPAAAGTPSWGARVVASTGLAAAATTTLGAALLVAF